jgi:lysophospholipase L1-like esterase
MKLKLNFTTKLFVHYFFIIFLIITFLAGLYIYSTKQDFIFRPLSNNWKNIEGISSNSMTILQYIQNNKGNLIAFGDSLTAGKNDPNWLSPYTNTLKKLTNNTISIINKGNPGDTSFDLSYRIKEDVLTQNPSVVIVWIGTNDIWIIDKKLGPECNSCSLPGYNDFIQTLPKDIDINKITTDNIIKMVTNIHTQIHNVKNTSNTQVYTIAMTLMPFMQDVKRTDINQGIRNMVSKMPFTFLIELDNIFDINDKQYWSDVPHLSPLGYETIGKKIFDFINTTPITNSPITNSPITNSPITNSPITNSPITNSPITNSPITTMPWTNSPTASPINSTNNVIFTNYENLLPNAKKYIPFNNHSNLYIPENGDNSNMILYGNDQDNITQQLLSNNCNFSNLPDYAKYINSFPTDSPEEDNTPTPT